MARTKKNYSAPALEKGLDIIELLSKSSLGFSQAEIAKELNRNFTNINFGLGSILSERDYLKGKDAGFHFFVSPGIVTTLVKNKVINYIPGGETISEFMYLLDNGYKNIKFFPANLAGGHKKLVSIENILKEACFIPTGGINKKNYMDFISLKNVLCVGMSKFDD